MDELFMLQRISTGHLCVDMTKDIYGKKLGDQEKTDFKQQVERTHRAVGTSGPRPPSEEKQSSKEPGVGRATE